MALVQVKHNGTDITTYVIEYERKHTICTGIGTLNLTVSLTPSRIYDPWDHFDIYENGVFQVRYYASSVQRDVPGGKIVIECQDISKRIVDYFIPKQYTIDYPSYTRYWIEKFLTEAGVSYQFKTSSQGNLLSNYTSLGLRSAYEQLIQLLQLSGWYMYFDGNGKAVIGNLTSNLSPVKGTYTEQSDILDISVNYDDKMLRNRSVVWGSFDPLRNEYSYADISVRTRWNYDSKDYRTMVISNQNIPTKTAAYSIAKKLLTEFSKITIEKHVTLAGAIGRDLGDVIRINSRAWRGKGLITSYGTRMSRGGLTTELVLDERCPRLFGFFDFGDYVYVGTYGDGVWRKHIRFDHTWYNFSSGLTNLGITDLHINYGTFGAVASSGEMYYAPTEDGPWVQYQIASLSSSVADSVELVSGVLPASGIPLTTFSGLMGRATIVDKETAVVKYAVDTFSGLNYGDYFMMWSGFLPVAPSGAWLPSGYIMPSGVSSSGYRSWIVEYDSYTNVSGVYPISWSGNFDMLAVDLENDGINDYVSVKMAVPLVLPYSGVGYNFGKAENSFESAGGGANKHAVVSFGNYALSSMQPSDILANSPLGSVAIDTSGMSVYNNESVNEREIVWMYASKIYKLKVLRNYNEVSKTWALSYSTTTSPTFSPTGQSLHMKKVSDSLYIYYTWSGSGATGVFTITSYTWDIVGGTVTSTVLATYTCSDNAFKSDGTADMKYINWTFIDDVLHLYWVRLGTAVERVPDTDPNVTEKVKLEIEIDHGTFSFSDHSTSYSRAYYWSSNINTETFLFPYYQIGTKGIFVHSDGTHPQLQIFYQYYKTDVTNPTNPFENRLLYTNTGTSFLESTVQTAVGPSDPDFMYGVYNFWSESYRKQLTRTRYYWFIREFGGDRCVLFNGTSILFFHQTTSAFYQNPSNISPMEGLHDHYFIAKDPATGIFYFCNPSTLLPNNAIIFPAGFTISTVFSTSDSMSPYYYWVGKDTENNMIILKTNLETVIEYVKSPNTTASIGEGYICGNFFVQNNPFNYTYINNFRDVPQGEAGYLLLQREGTDFNLIQRSYKPIRVDISNRAPIVTDLDTEVYFQTHYINGNQLSTTSVNFSFLPLPSGVRDFRYTMMDIPSGVAAFSGALNPLEANKTLLYVYSGAVNYTFTDTLSSGFSPLYTIPSGQAERIETTSFVGSGQYIFVTTSGEYPAFYQKDPEEVIFTPYSGLPQSRATIIRIDDMF